MPQLPNFPQPPRRQTGQSMTFPEDLVQGNRKFYTGIDFIEYQAFAGANLGGGGGGGFIGASSIKLPLPKRINDNQNILWNEDSLTRAGLGVMSQVLGGGIGNRLASAVAASVPALEAAGGEAINPYQFMYFRRPAYKEHQLSWTLAANTRKESDALKDIVKKCKAASLPSKQGATTLKYPQVALITLYPKEYLFEFKPCAILGVQVDHTGSGQPSFFNSGAATVVNLTLHLKEIVLWTSEEIQ